MNAKDQTWSCRPYFLIPFVLVKGFHECLKDQIHTFWYTISICSTHRSPSSLGQKEKYDWKLGISCAQQTRVLAKI